MGGLLGCAKSRKLKLNQQEQAIFDCKKTRDKIKDYIKSLERNEKIRREKAKDALKEKNKDRAKLYLKQSKLYREQINAATGQLNVIEEQITQIETAQNQREIFKVLEQGNKALKSLTEEVSVEKWEKVTDDFADIKQQQEEIANFFKNHGIDENQYEEEVDNELEKLMKLESEEIDTVLPVVNNKDEIIDLPNARKDSNERLKIEN
jgi:hypothetical protein